MALANPLSPRAVSGSRLSRSGAWLWSFSLWSLFICYCVFTVIQAVQKTQRPLKSTSYSSESAFAMPSVLLCSFGQYDLDIFEAEYPTLYLGNYEVVHTFEDMLTPSVLNKTSAFAPGTDLNISGAYGHNDLVTMVQNCGNMTASRPNDLPHLSVNASGFCNFSLPQLMGVVRSAAVNATNPVEAYNGLSKTRWCIMWTPYRLTLDHPSDVSLSNAAISTGSVDYRQLDTRQVWRVGINLNGRALMEDQAWQNVWQDPGGPEANTGFAPTLSVKFIDFSGMREEEWLSGSQSSQYLKDVLESSDPDGFELVTLNSIVTLSVQKTVTTTLSGLQKLGWPWTPWPWSDNSAYQQTSYQVLSSSMAPNPFYSNTSYYATVTEDVEQGGWTHTLAICMLRGTKQVLLVTDVSVIYGLFGNIGGALSLVVMLYGCLYTIKAYSPEVSTEFQIKGVDTLQYILSLFARLRRCSWHCKDRAAQTFKPLTLQGPGSTSTPTLITGRQQLMLSQNHHVAV